MQKYAKKIKGKEDTVKVKGEGQAKIVGEPWVLGFSDEQRQPSTEISSKTKRGKLIYGD